MKPSMKLIYAIFVLANVFLLFGSLALGRQDLALLNLVSGVLCTFGYYNHKNLE